MLPSLVDATLVTRMAEASGFAVSSEKIRAAEASRDGDDAKQDLKANCSPLY